MIDISCSYNCCGCSACLQKCPQKCISMQQDREGFYYPKVDLQKCINCGLCEKVCPVINKNENRYPLENFAAKSKDELLRKESSSGGIFTILAEFVVSQGGVVFGASYDENWMVVHSYVRKKEDLYKFRGSKYLQSSIGNSYQDAEKFLKRKELVLFSGTSCQIAGLRRFLCKDYPNLITVDCICHGVPSPGVWDKYLKDSLYESKKILGKNSNPAISNILFREKSNGWKNYHFVKEITDSADGKKILKNVFHKNDLYMRAFLRAYIIRPSCYKCPAKSGSSYSDITLADFWDVEKVVSEWNDDKGISSIMVNTERGKNLLASVMNRLDVFPVTLEQATICNKGYFRPCGEPPYRKLFWVKYRFFKKLNNFVLKQTLLERIILKVIGILRR